MAKACNKFTNFCSNALFYMGINKPKVITPGDDWILRTGFWDDAGTWIDGDNWID
jgi:hypothetical protein